jgi:mono/diheme cytochrome c family protein
MKRGLLLGLVLGFMLSTVDLPTAWAQDDGATLLDQRCSVCHSSDRPKSKKKTPEEWNATVTRMIGKGAKLSPDEKQVLIDYLSKTYKP